MKRKGEKRLVVFGAGYLGRAVAAEGLKRDWRVNALTWNRGDAGGLEEMGVQNVVCANLAERDWHGLIEPHPDYVIDCAGSGRGGKEGYEQSYLKGMRSILEWMAGGSPAEAMIFTSSTSVYGQVDGEWVDEEADASGGGETGRVLRETEGLLLATTSCARHRAVLRLGGIYGPGRAFLLRRARQPELKMDESDRAYLNSIRLEDIVSAVFAVFQHGTTPWAGVVNVVDDEPSRKSEILTALHLDLRERGLLSEGGEPFGRRRGGIRANRRIGNALLKRRYGWRPAFPSWREGYADLWREIRRIPAGE